MFPQKEIGEGFPVTLLLIPNGEIAFVPNCRFKGMYDYSTDDLYVFFDSAGFVINGNEYNYHTAYAYKELPDLLEWLKGQNLMM